jgi:two-component sensor histidine kinase
MNAVQTPSTAEYELRLKQLDLVAKFGVFAMQTENGLDEIMQEASIVAAEGLAAHFAKVLEKLPSEPSFLVRSGVGWGEGVVGQATIGSDLESPAGFAFRTKQPVISNHLASETRFRTPSLLAQHGIKSAINVIIRSPSGDAFGVLEGDSSGRNDFSHHDILFLQTLANTLGAALEMQQRQDARDEAMREKDQLIVEKDLLTQEVHHRVKNSLQLVVSLLNLQARSQTIPEAKHQLEAAASRIVSVAAVHHRLYAGGSVEQTDARIYVQNLVSDVFALAPEQVRSRTIEVEIADLLLGADHVTHLGLIITELVTNAIKYGQGKIRVEVHPVEDGLEVAVSDEGPGFPAGFDPAASPGFGMRVIAALSKRGDGGLLIDRSVTFGRVVAQLANPGSDGMNRD